MTWGAGVPAGREDVQVAAMSLSGDNALSIVDTFSGTTDDTPVFTNFDQTAESFFYAGVNADNTNTNASPTFDALTLDYDSGNAVLNSHTSRARGHYFSSGMGGASLAVTGDDSASRIAVVEAVPEPTTTALLGLGGLALILRRRK